jgi:integrase
LYEQHRVAERASACRREVQERLGKDAPWGFKHVRVHDLKHTFGRRLRAARVPFETRQTRLSHKNGSITTHYSAAEIGELMQTKN